MEGVWSRKQVEIYSDNYILYLLWRGKISEGNVKRFEHRKSHIMDMIVENNVPRSRLPFVLVANSYSCICLIDVDYLSSSPVSKCDAIAHVINKKRKFLALRDLQSIVLAHDAEILRKKSASPEEPITAPKGVARGSYAYLVELPNCSTIFYFQLYCKYVKRRKKALEERVQMHSGN